ncbi:hypothetical protein N9783_03615, partial [Planktomarina temperata]|nr:hypothetical protein [Planktomarina temperata]
ESRRIASKINEKALKYWSLRQAVTNAKLHVFVVNNSYAAIVTSRIIALHNLKNEEVLIVYHRINSSQLLDRFNSLKVHCPDIETGVSDADIKKVFSIATEILTHIGSRNFALYAYHYFALLTSTLAWSPNCVQCNLVEEGNLNSRLVHHASRQSRMNEYQFFLERLNSGQLPIINFYIFNEIKINKKKLFSNTPSSLKIPDYITGAKLSSDDIAIINEIEHDYFFHPKMSLGTTYYRLAKSEKCGSDHCTINVNTSSKDEDYLIEQYHNKFRSEKNETNIVIVLPVALTILKKFSAGMTRNKNKFRGCAKLHFELLFHPASKSQDEVINDLESAINVALEDNNYSISTVNHDVVSDLYCSQADIVIHFGSSIAYSASILNDSLDILDFSK